ncbi:MAG: ferritin [Candidatus Theseobacter exili]|nr:ferritin [Candidatus Theseobacter exili]
MISKKMEMSINEQINREIFSAYLYLGMASYTASEGFSGVSNWFNVQVQEELAHAQIMYNYVIQQNGRVIMKAIEEPPQDFKSVLDLFEKTLEHERKVTAFIYGLVDIARKENDHATEIFLQWFVSEQVEEESSASDMVNKLKMAGDSENTLLMIDKDLAQRVFNPPKTK